MGWIDVMRLRVIVCVTWGVYMYVCDVTFPRVTWCYAFAWRIHMCRAMTHTHVKRNMCVMWHIRVWRNVRFHMTHLWVSCHDTSTYAAHAWHGCTNMIMTHTHGAWHDSHIYTWFVTWHMTHTQGPGMHLPWRGTITQSTTTHAHVKRTGWRRLIGCLKLQVIFRKRATNHRALLQKMTYEDKASYDSTPHCNMDACTMIMTHTHGSWLDTHTWHIHMTHTHGTYTWLMTWHTHMAQAYICHDAINSQNLPRKFYTITYQSMPSQIWILLPHTQQKCMHLSDILIQIFDMTHSLFHLTWLFHVDCAAGFPRGWCWRCSGGCRWYPFSFARSLTRALDSRNAAEVCVYFFIFSPPFFSLYSWFFWLDGYVLARIHRIRERSCLYCRSIRFFLGPWAKQI